MFEDEKETIEAFFRNDLIDKENYNIALEQGLWKCRFNPINESAFQYALIESEEKLTENGITLKCNQIADILKSFFLSNEDNSFDGEKWIAQVFTDFKIVPVKYGFYEYGDDEFHTSLIVKIVYEYNVDFRHFLERIEDECIDEVEQEIENLKNGLKIFLEETVDQCVFAEEPGMLEEIVNQWMDETNCYFQQINSINECDTDELIDMSDADEFIDL